MLSLRNLICLLLVLGLATAAPAKPKKLKSHLKKPVEKAGLRLVSIKTGKKNRLGVTRFYVTIKNLSGRDINPATWGMVLEGDAGHKLHNSFRGDTDKPKAERKKLAKGKKATFTWGHYLKDGQTYKIRIYYQMKLNSERIYWEPLPAPTVRVN